MLVVDKEPELARHQSGDNSGVLHSGLYYAPGLAEGDAVPRGREAMLAFAAEQGIPCAPTASSSSPPREAELAGLAELHRRGLANGLQRAARARADGVAEIEPHVRGVCARCTSPRPR